MLCPTCAYDAEQLRENRLANEKASHAIVERHIAVSMMAQNLLVQCLKEITPDNLTPRILMEGL